MGITGLSLVLFLIAHLLGNLTILIGAKAFNEYAYFLHHLGHGWVILLAELGLVAFFVLHIYFALSVQKKKKSARTTDYYKVEDAGGASKKNLASQNMIVTGLVLLAFTVIHLLNFKYGPDYRTTIDGVEMRDIYRLVIESFNNPLYVLFYAGSMLFLGTHLMHGIFSGLQSLGATRPDLSKGLHLAGKVFGWILAFGFVIIPIIAFFMDPVAAVEAGKGK